MIELILVGIVVGFLSGLFGVGGGFLLVPALKIIFNIPYNIAVGSSLFQMFFVSIIGCILHYKLKHVNLKLGFILLSSVLGIEIGAQILDFFKELEIVDFIVASLLLILVMYFSFRMYKEANEYKSVPADLKNYKIDLKNRIPQISTVSFSIGILTGLVGIGGAFILNPYLISYQKFPAVIVVGTSLFVVIFNSFYGTFTHFLKGNVDINISLNIVLGSIPGVIIGSFLSDKFRGKRIRLYFSIVLFVVGLVILFDLIKKIL